MDVTEPDDFPLRDIGPEGDDDSLVIIPQPSSSIGTGVDVVPIFEDGDNEERADKLRKMFRENVKALSKRRRPLNVLILGKAAQGKSAFLRSCAIATLKKWGGYVYVGSEGGKGKSYVTAYLKRLNLLDPTEGDPMIDQDESFTDPDVAFLQKNSPRFFDMTGMPDEDSHETREIFRRILNGGIPLGTPLLQLIKEASGPRGAEAIRKKYWGRNDALCIDRIIVVMSTMEEHPTQLAEALMKAAQPKGVPDPDDGYIYKRAVPVFGVITMMDKWRTMDDEERKKFMDREKTFIASLAMIGGMERLCRCTNYFSETIHSVTRSERVNDPKKDCKILTFLDYLMDPDMIVEHEGYIPFRPVDYAGPLKAVRASLSKLSRTDFLIAFLVVIIAVLFFMVLHPSR